MSNFGLIFPEAISNINDSIVIFSNEEYFDLSQVNGIYQIPRIRCEAILCNVSLFTNYVQNSLKKISLHTLSLHNLDKEFASKMNFRRNSISLFVL